MSAAGNTTQPPLPCDLPATSPTFLTPGTAVSAKYRGAFCEATVDQVDLKFRLRVQVEGSSKHVLALDQTHLVSGEPKVGATVVVSVPSSNGGHSNTEKSAIILRVADTSVYTVVFDDGDKRTLRRTQLVIKGERHFKESESLDCLPLTNPEQFRQPVIDRRRQVRSDNEEDERESSGDLHSLDDQLMSDDQEHKPVMSVGHEIKGGNTPSLLDDSMIPPTASVANVETSKICQSLSLNFESDAPSHRLLGRLVLVEHPVSNKDSAGNQSFSLNDSISSTEEGARRRFPALVVLPSAMPGIDLRPIATSKNSSNKTPLLLVRSFKDNRFFPVPVTQMKRLKRVAAVDLAHKYSALRTAVERALLWLDRYELPAPWGENAVQSLLGTSDWRSTKRAQRIAALTAPTIQSPAKTSSQSLKGCKIESRKPLTTSSDDDDHNECHTSSKSKPIAPKTKTAITNQSRKRTRVSDCTARGSSQNLDSKRPRLKKITDRQSTSTGTSLKAGRSRSVKKDRKKMGQSSDASSNNTLSSVSAEDLFSSHSSTDNKSSSDSDSNVSTSSTSSPSSTSSSSVEFEARDRWIAQLYRFMDEGGTPINKAPSLANKDLDLYRLYKLVRQLGGFHRVTAQMKWGYIYSKLGLPHHFAAGPRNLQVAFKRYLYPLDDASRKLGTDLDALPLSRPRHTASANASTVTASTRPTTATARSTLSSTTNTVTMTTSDSKLSSTAPKRSEKSGSSTPKPVLTTKDSVWQPVSQPLESSPPVLSPPILSGPTPSPPCGDWIPSSPESDVKSSGSGELEPVWKMKRRRLDKTSSNNVSSREPTPSSNPERTTSKHPGKISGPSSKSSDRALSISARRDPIFLDDLKPQRISKNKRVVPIGSLVRVQCGDNVAYEAKILRHIRPHPPNLTPNDEGSGAGESKYTSRWSNSPPELKYQIHYIGWNPRHDEVISRARIISVIEWARPVEIHRPPSCSSLNIIVREPTNSASTHADVKRSATSSTSSEARGKKPTNSSAMTKRTHVDEQDQESDYSHTAETASDIVTTTAPTIRHRRLMFDKTRLSQYRDRNKRERSNTLKSDTKSDQSTRFDRFVSIAKSKQPRTREEQSKQPTEKSVPDPVSNSSKRTRQNSTSSSITDRHHPKEISCSTIRPKTNDPIPKFKSKSGVSKPSSIKPKSERTTPRKLIGMLSKSPLSKSCGQSERMVPHSLRKLGVFTDRKYSSRVTPLKKAQSGRHENSMGTSVLSRARTLVNQSETESSLDAKRNQSRSTDSKNVKSVVPTEKTEGKKLDQLPPSLKSQTQSSSKSVSELTSKSDLVTTTGRKPSSIPINSGSRSTLQKIDPITKEVKLRTKSQSKPSDLPIDRYSKRSPSNRTSSEDSNSPRPSAQPSASSKVDIKNQESWDEHPNIQSDSENSETDSTSSEYGALDALPRLTRSQHRQLLGDTPPGAALRTASPVVVGDANVSEQKIEETLGPLAEKDSGQTVPVTAGISKVDCLVPSSEVLPSPMTIVKAESVTTDETVVKVESDDADTLQCSSENLILPKRSIQLRPRGARSSTSLAVQSPILIAKVEQKETPTDDLSLGKHADDEVEEAEERGSQGSIHTASTAPMKELTFELPLSPDHECSTLPSPTGPPNDDAVATIHSERPLSNAAHSSEEDLDDVPGTVVRSGTTRSKEQAPLETTAKRSPINVRSRVRLTSTSSVSDTVGGRKTKKSSAVEHSQVMDRSPTSVSSSPQHSKSPASTSDTKMFVATVPEAGSHSVEPVGQVPIKRRFGGPFLPIPGYDEMNSEMRCLHLQERMHRILEAWRSAKQYLKDLEQRSNKTRRIRTKESRIESTQHHSRPTVELVGKELRSDSISIEQQPASNSPHTADSPLMCS